MRDEASQQGAEAAEPEQECGEQDSEPGGSHLSDNCGTFTKYNVRSKRAETAEPEQESGEQDSEPATTDGESVWKQMREEVLQNAPEEANLQAEGAAETEHGKGEKEVEPTETERASRCLPADLNLTSFEVKMERA